ncbi:hypothetical protein M9Y10_043476 [Tritrichomonas musculus]|uniref:Uncharacterized protein n=1 Tax=Tritrichomonas musculus TaxID=1915356 RepID=A0ABR2JZS7_9EUKA
MNQEGSEAQPSITSPYPQDSIFASFLPETSPNGTRRIHLDDIKQSKLDEKVSETVAEHGGLNYIQAKYVSQLCEVVVNNPELSEDSANKLRDLQPKVKSNLLTENELYRRALCISVAFIKRYKMVQTLDAIKKEYAQTPKSTGFSKASELERTFEGLFQTARDSEQTPFNTKARAFEKKVSELYEVPPAWLDDTATVRSPRSMRSWKAKQSAKSSAATTPRSRKSPH